MKNYSKKGDEKSEKLGKMLCEKYCKIKTVYTIHVDIELKAEECGFVLYLTLIANFEDKL